MLPVEAPFKTYTGLDGKPLNNGYVYFGLQNENPITSPVEVYWDAAGTIPAAQPLRTVNGYIMRAGTPANVFYSGNYSELAQDSKKRQVFYARNSADFSIASAVQTLIDNISGDSGAENLGVLLPGEDAIVHTLETELRQGVKVTRWMTDAQIMDAFLKVRALDCAPAIQKAVTYCIANDLDLEFPYLFKINSSINVDRLVDSVSYDSYFTMFTKSGGGLYVDSAINMFSSTVVDPVAAVTQLIRWDSLRFVASNNSLAAYVLHGIKFLRSEFVGCNFSKIKALVSDRYVQSIYFLNCNARRWSGAFFKCGPQGYDIQVIGGLYEAGSGDCFDIKAPIGCKFWTQIEGMSGTALKINGAQGVDISCYFEANGLDVDSRTGGLTSQGINIHGCVIARSDTVYSILWGTCYGCVSQGNWHTGYAHDLQADSLVEINDYAQYSLSNSGDVKAHGGYREGQTAPLVIRGATSSAYTVSGLISNFTRIGYRNVVDFVCTLTSTGTNPQDSLFISGTFPANAAHAGVICGTVEVAGSTINNGISPLYISLALPMRVASSLAVIPANVAGAAYTVRGQVSWQGAS